MERSSRDNLAFDSRFRVSWFGLVLSLFLFLSLCRDYNNSRDTIEHDPGILISDMCQSMKTVLTGER